MTNHVEVLVVRDPDGPLEVRVFVRGAEDHAYALHVVDAGAGHLRSDWDEQTTAATEREPLSRAYRDAIADARTNPPGAEYIEED